MRFVWREGLENKKFIIKINNKKPTIKKDKMIRSTILELFLASWMLKGLVIYCIPHFGHILVGLFFVQ